MRSNWRSSRLRGRGEEGLKEEEDEEIFAEGYRGLGKEKEQGEEVKEYEK